jgi:hypothetical protein
MFEDFYLRWLVSIVEDSDFRTNVTLNVGGIMLLGDMVSEAEFFEGLAATLPQEQRENFATLPSQFDAVAEQAVSEGADPLDVPETRESRSGSFIHLTNVRTFEGGEYHEFPEVFWRGRVADMDGFWLGTPSRDV